jgi:RNA polymerase sigma-70 factor (ECF subfamily)
VRPSDTEDQCPVRGVVEMSVAQLTWEEAGSAAAGEVLPQRAAANRAMDRYADGNEEAFSALYDILAPRLYAFVHRQTHNHAAAEDIVQQTLLQMHCARSSFVRGAEVIPWAFAIARRLLIDGYRRGRYAEVLLEDAVEDERPSQDGSPDEILQSKQLVDRLERALMKLPESQRVTFQLVRQEGLSAAEAAAVLGTTENAVKLRAHRTYEALRRALCEKGRKL